MADTGSGDSRSLNVIRSWEDVEDVPPEILREWLSEEVARCEAEYRDIMDRVEGIRSGPTADKLQACTLLTDGSIIRVKASQVIRNLTDDIHPTIPAALAVGLRLGMAYWNLRGIRSGVPLRAWQSEDRCEDMRDKKVDADEERRNVNRDRALEALAVVKRKFPTEAEDGNEDFLMQKACEHLKDDTRPNGISRRTLNRWLGGK